MLSRIYDGIAFAVGKVFGSRNERVLKNLQPAVTRVLEYEERLRRLSDPELAEKTDGFRRGLGENGSLDEILPEAFACVRESARRNLGMRHFDVQILGGIILHQGKIAEMVTGEGKTLVATAPAYLNALLRREGQASHVHVITVNDYLARRDAAWMGPVYRGLGLQVGCIQSNMSNADRKEQYGCDITYGTNNEFGFDYLRDNMKITVEDQVQKLRHFTIIDEVDSVLVDEARTPLIISGAAEEATDKYYKAMQAVETMKGGDRAEIDHQVLEAAKKGHDKEEIREEIEKDFDYVYSEKDHTAHLTDRGIERAMKALGVKDFYSGRNIDWPHYLENAVRAKSLYHRDVHYVAKEGQVIIVDEFTGRLMEGRRWSDGLHQAVEAKEGLKIRQENQTLATITFQNFFKLYDKISGMTGTAMTEAKEFMQIYKLDVVAIPPNRPLRRTSEPDLVFGTEQEKFEAIAAEIEGMNSLSRPVLVGTTSIEKSEQLSRMLKRRGVKHEVLNAKHHEREAAIIADAGQQKAVTIATNMAGRGTDIVLGEGVAELGGLHVLGTERHEARRIDNQLRGRAGRQGDPGSSRFFLSLDDDLMRIFASDWVRTMLQRTGLSGGQPLESRMVTGAIEKAQKRVEEHNFAIRKRLLEYDEVNNEQRTLIYDRRQEILEGGDTKARVLEMIDGVIDEAASGYSPPGMRDEDRDLTGLSEWLKRKFTVVVDPVEWKRMSQDQIYEDMYDRVGKAYTAREQAMGEGPARALERFVLLEVIDRKWKDHLREMDHLKESIWLRSYAQKDPRIEYKREGYSLFNELMGAIYNEVTDLIFRVSVVSDEDRRALQERWDIASEGRGEMENLARKQQADIATADAAGGEGRVTEPIKRTSPRVGRNDPCPCGSGKKYKNCCMRKKDTAGATASRDR
ncbi:MAG: preprotein translocase subunit SecA [Planctomycetes bacterium]|nr:preprotein translocase subunit SecA [Planctomycetota bacterium]